MFEPPQGEWEIVRWAFCSDKDVFIEYLDRPAFVRFLRQFKRDRKVMANLRSVLMPPYQISLADNDEVIEMVAWKVAAHHLAIRLALKDHGPDVQSSGDGGGGGGAAKREQQQPQKPKTPPPSRAAPVVVPNSRNKKSWFAVTVVYEENGQEKAVENLSLQCQLPDLGMTGGTVSRKSPVVRFDDLKPGGTGDILATSHDEVVWEVTADID